MGESAWWEAWAAEVANGHVRPPAIARMRAEPGFNDAMRYSVRAALDAAEHEKDLRETTPDTAAAYLALTIHYLDYTGGLTHRRLREAAGMSGVLSAGRVSALLLRLRMVGLLEVAHDQGRGRVKLYRPTQRMIALSHRRYRCDLEAIGRLTPDTGWLLQGFDRPEGFRAFVVQFGGLMLAAVRRQGREADPEFPPAAAVTKAISERAGGISMLLAILDQAGTAAGRFPAAGPAEVSTSTLARRFGVSRTHVRRVLSAAIEHGLLAPGTREGEVIVLPALVEAMAHIHATMFIVFAGVAYAGLRPDALAAGAGRVG